MTGRRRALGCRRHGGAGPLGGRLAAGAALALALALSGCGATPRGAAPHPSSTTSTPAADRTSTTTTAPVPTTAPPASSTTTSPTAQLPPELSGRVWDAIPTTAHVVALTFDAGANADGLPSILATLRSTGAPASFFLTGNFARSFPALAVEVAAGGFRIGNHSMDHPAFTHLSDAQVQAEVLDAAAAVRGVTGIDPAPLFRFPYGDYDTRTLADVNDLGYAAVGWTVDTLGWEGTSAGITTSSIVARVMAGLRPGEIVLMHVGSNPTDGSTLDAAALPAVVAAVRGAGYALVSLSSLVGS